MMSRTEKILYGIFAFLPLALSIGLFISIMGPLNDLMSAAGWHPDDPGKALRYMPDLVSSVFVFVIVMAIAKIGLLVAYIIHVSRNQAVQDGARLGWIIAFFVAGTFAVPVYFFVHIWNRNQAMRPGSSV